MCGCVSCCMCVLVCLESVCVLCVSGACGVLSLCFLCGLPLHGLFFSLCAVNVCDRARVLCESAEWDLALLTVDEDDFWTAPLEVGHSMYMDHREVDRKLGVHRYF